MAAYIFTSPKHTIINRKYGKVDDVFSYIGGLLSILVGIIGLLLFAFNEYRYELKIAEGTVKFKSTDQLRENHFGFFTFLKLILYSFINLFKTKKL